MKLDKSCTVWINCRTTQEREEILDIFEVIGATWAGNKPMEPRKWTSYKAPMHYLLENGRLMHGDVPVTGKERYVTRGIIVEAKDFHNQWISARR